MTAASDLIVCATDFSEAAKSAVEWAAGFARREGRARRAAARASRSRRSDREQLAADAAVFEAARLEDARERLAAEAASLTHATGVSIQPELLSGPPEVRIVEQARLHGARAIVVGVSDQPLVERWVLGSVAERVVRSAPCPVVVVPRRDPNRPWFPATERRRRAERRSRTIDGAGRPGGTGGQRAARQSRGPAPPARALRRHLPAPLLAHRGVRPARPARRPQSAGAVDPDVVENLEPPLAIARGRSARAGAPLRSTSSRRSARPAANLALAAENRTFDLLVVGSHQRHGLARILKGSVAQTFAHQATRVPVICVPLPARGARCRRGGCRAARPDRPGGDGPLRRRERGDPARVRDAGGNRRRRRALPRA